MPDLLPRGTLAPVANKITALAGISNQALASGELPKRLKLFNWGDNPSDKGVFKVTPLTVAALQKQIADQSYRRIVLDFEHNSLKGHPNYKPAPRHHAGYGDVEIVPQDGVYLSAIEYTPAGKEFARDNSDLSPVPIHTDDGTIIGLISCALLPNGSLHNVTYFSAAAPGASGAEPVNPQTKEPKMEITALEARVTALTSENQTLRTDLSALAAKILDGAKFTALETLVTALTAKITALETADVQRAKDALLAGATQAGKVVALEADVIKTLSVEQLTKHIEKVPVTVPFTRRTPTATPLSAADKGSDLLAQYNAITDPKERAAFYKKNQAALGC